MWLFRHGSIHESGCRISLFVRCLSLKNTRIFVGGLRLSRRLVDHCNTPPIEIRAPDETTIAYESGHHRDSYLAGHFRSIGVIAVAPTFGPHGHHEQLAPAKINFCVLESVGRITGRHEFAINGPRQRFDEFQSSHSDRETVACLGNRINGTRFRCNGR